MTRALLIEPQSLFAPYFAGVLTNAGTQVTITGRARKRDLRALDPGLVVVDAAGAGHSPLRVISRLRASLPNARIVVFACAFEPLWESLAHAVGADAVVGPSANETDLLAAIAC